MIGVTAMMAAVLILGGILVGIAGMRPGPVQAGKPQLTLAQHWARLTHRPPGKAGRQRDLLWAAALAAGVLVYVITHWRVMVAIVPVMILMAPTLLGAAPHTNIPLMEALDRWIRGIAAVMPQGVDVAQAIRLSRRRCPELIEEEVKTLVRRMDVGMSTKTALLRFADDLDDSEADAVVAALVLAVDYAEGSAKSLESIADGLQDRMRVLRNVEAERNKPRQEARAVTLVSLILLVLAGLVARTTSAALSTPMGQVLLAACSTAYLLGSWRLYQITVPRKRARILVQDSRGGLA